MANGDTTRVENVKIVMLKGEKGDGVEHIEDLVSQEALARVEEDASLQTQINAESARVDNIISQTRSEVVTLWTGSMSASGGTYTLSESVANFDFIDIYCENLSTHFVRIPASKSSLNLYIPYFDNSASNKTLEIGKLSLSISGTSVTLSAPKEWFWDGTSANNSTVLDAQISVPVRIDGVRYARLESSEVADIRVGADGTTYPNAGGAVRKQVSKLTSNIKSAYYWEENFGIKGVFVQGSLISGVLHTDYYKYRVATDTLLSYERDITVTIASGYKIGVHTFVNGEFSADSGWKTGTYTIAKDTVFKVVIAKATETYEDADVETFVNAVTFGSKTSGLSNDVEKALHMSVFSFLDVECERGGYSGIGLKDNSTYTLSARIRIKDGIKVKKGDYFINDSGLAYGVIFIDTTLNSPTDSGWLTTPNTKWIAPSDGYVRITLRKQVDGAIADGEIDTLRAKLNGYIQYFERVGFDEIENLKKTVKQNQDGFTYFDSSLFVYGGLENGELNQSYYNFRVCTPNIISFDYPIYIKAENGYRFGIATFTDEDVYSGWSGWLSNLNIPANQKFKLQIAGNPDLSIKVSGIEDVLISKVLYTTKLGAELSKEIFAYSVSGVPINVDVQKYNVDAMTVVSKSPSAITVGEVNSNQGMAICNGVIFQLYSNDVVELIDYETGEIIADLTIKSDHGDCIDFSDEYYQQGDEFPLAYITADTNPAKVYVNRITRTGTTLIKTLTFPLDKTGYYAGHALDATNKIIYQVGYTENSYYLDENGTNFMIVSVWDLKSLTDNGDDTFTPEFIKSFKLPFLITTQGQAFFDNKIVTVSSHFSNTITRIVFIDCASEKIVSVIEDLPTTIKNVECEGVSFVKESNKYVMVIKPNNTNYYKVNFN